MAEVIAARVEVCDDRNQKYTVPYWRVRSGKNGPCLLVTAAIHGTELHGVESIRRFLPLAADGLARGECLLVPVANPLAVQKRQPHMDFDSRRYFGTDTRHNANCVWPGAAGGNNAERLAHALFQQVVPRATHLIDLHAYSRIWAPVVYARTNYAPSLQLARAAGLRFGRHSDAYPDAAQRPVFPCILSTLFNETDRTAIAIELSGQCVIAEAEAACGLRAIVNCCKSLEMLPGEPEILSGPMVWLNDARELKIAAPHAGLFIPAPVALGGRLEKDALLGCVLDLQDLRQTPVRAPAAGWLYRFGPIRGVSKNDIAEDPMTVMHPYTTAGEILAIILGD